jgi:hypothetical protein
MVWSLLCSAVLGLGASGCVRSCGQPEDLDEPGTGGEPAAAEKPGKNEVDEPPAPEPAPAVKKVVEEQESELDDVYGPPTAPAE